MPDNMRIYSRLMTTPKDAQKQIQAGRLKGFTDINPMYRIKALTEIYGPCGIGWYTDILRRETIPGPSGELACFIDLNLYVKENNEWSQPIFGTGGNMLIAKESGGLRVNDEGWKMAYTDAMSIACKNLGMNADIYYAKGYGKYTQPDGDNAPPPPPPNANGNTPPPVDDNAPLPPPPPNTSGKKMALVEQIQYIIENASDKMYEQAMTAFGANLENMTFSQADKLIKRIEEGRENA